MATLEEFKSNLRGHLLRPGDALYDEARKLWNGIFDRRPAMIVRSAGVADVIAALNFARESGLRVAIRGGGHSFPGHSVCEGGLLVDLSPMKGIRVDPVRRTARAQAGVKWLDFDHETQRFGLATTGGTASDTGIAGLTLGGGLGWLSSKYGLAVDNLISADVVLADGRFLTASAPKTRISFGDCAAVAATSALSLLLNISSTLWGRQSWEGWSSTHSRRPRKCSDSIGSSARVRPKN